MLTNIYQESRSLQPIIKTSHERDSVSKHRQLDCFFQQRVQTKSCALLAEISSLTDSPYERTLRQKKFPCHPSVLPCGICTMPTVIPATISPTRSLLILYFFIIRTKGRYLYMASRQHAPEQAHVSLKILLALCGTVGLGVFFAVYWEVSLFSEYTWRSTAIWLETSR